MNVKEQLMIRMQAAFAGDEEMSLTAAARGLTPAEAAWPMNAATPTIEEILYHVAKWKIEYCRQGFGKWQEPYGRPFGDPPAMLALLDKAQAHLVACLTSCSPDEMDKPLPIRFHGESAAHFFSVMITHDLWHGAQIDMIRRAHDPPAEDIPYGPMADAR